uniref:Uncharacterized protein n=1 Tax=Ditylenchus dipsaci TaxID=166011 RepID=A0A915EIV4_9BILA
MQMLERLPKTCDFSGQNVRQLKILEQEVEYCSWLVLEQNLTHNGLPRKFLRAILKRELPIQNGTHKILEEFNCWSRKKSDCKASATHQGQKTDMKLALMKSVQTMTQKIEKSALTVDTAESEDSSDEKTKFAPALRLFLKSNHHKENTMTKRSATAQEYSPDEEEYLDSSSESENESSSKECSEAEENQENSTTTWAYGAITTDEGQNPQQTLKTEEQQNS